MNWQGRDIQIVAFAVPYPPDYGGVIDVYHKIRTLRDIGVKVHLHAYQYKQHQPHRALEELCASVQYYPRSISSRYLQGWPYVVASRYNQSLLRNVTKLASPVLLEALHTAWLVPHLKEADIPHAVRMHNIEWKYYQFLAAQEASFAKKRYFLEESSRLREFEKTVANSRLMAISPVDEAYLKQRYPLTQSKLIYPFHGYEDLRMLEGKGDYALFHGNLGVNENERAALWLIQNVFAKIDHPLLIAGKQPSGILKQAVSAYKHIRLIPDPTADEMEQLQLQAQIHLLPNQQPTGMKLKWANALFTARFIVAHPDMAESGNPEAGIWSAESPEQYIKMVQSLWESIVDTSLIKTRSNYLGNNWSNRGNAVLIMNSLLG